MDFAVEFEVAEELRDLIAPPSESERASLAAAIKREGCLDPLKVYCDEADGRSEKPPDGSTSSSSQMRLIALKVRFF